MPDSTDLTDQIVTNASSPNAATADGVSVTQNSPSELIEAQKFLAAQRAARQAGGGIRFVGIIAPGAQ